MTNPIMINTSQLVLDRFAHSGPLVTNLFPVSEVILLFSEPRVELIPSFCSSVLWRKFNIYVFLLFCLSIMFTFVLFIRFTVIS